MKIYIAGPMTGYQNFNREAFNKVAEQIQLHGDVALNPAILPDGLAHDEYMTICMAMLDVAEEVVMLPNWEYSVGANKEHDRATQRGMQITYLEALA